MNDVDQSAFRRQLLAKQKELLEFEEAFSEQAQPVKLDQARVGRLSRMDAMQAQQMAMEGNRRRKQQLLEIQAALRRIDADDFGYCRDCGEVIDPRRLLADPSNAKCVHCAD